MVPGRSGPRMTLAEDCVPGAARSATRSSTTPARSAPPTSWPTSIYAGIWASSRAIAALPDLEAARVHSVLGVASHSGATGSTSYASMAAPARRGPSQSPGRATIGPDGAEPGPTAPAGRGRGPGGAARTDHARRRPGVTARARRRRRRGARAAGRHARPRAGGERGGGSDKVEFSVAGLLVLPEPRPASGRQATA